MNKIVVIYHRADFDGIFCREIARKFLPDAQLVGWDYGDSLDDLKNGINNDDQVYMLDISVDGLMDHRRLVWIDHHKSAMEKFHHGIPGYRIDGVAACRLAWQWFSNKDAGYGIQFGFARHTEGVEPHCNFAETLPKKEQFIDRTVDEPLAIRLAGEYDIWDKRDERAELFKHGLRSMDLEPHWKAMLSNNNRPTISELEDLISTGHQCLLEPDGSFTPPIVYTLLDNGRCLQYAKTRENESIIKAAGFAVQFDGLTFLACNHARYNSFLFTAGLKPEHDACLGFCWRDGQWVVSLYHAPGKEHHDLSLIAVKHGGGGHRGACGFRTHDLPFLK